MKIFAIYLRLNLTQKPIWFDEFRLKYDEPYELHITLIQPRYVNEQKVDDLKLKVGKFLSENKFEESDKVINFDELVYDQENDGTYTIMLLTKKAQELFNFQKGLREVLKDFTNYVTKENIEYEENFRPHITIGRNIKSEVLNEAKQYFQSGFKVEGTLTELVLPIVKDLSDEERKTPDNMMVGLI